MEGLGHRMQRILSIWDEIICGGNAAIFFHRSSLLPFSKVWNRGGKYSKKLSFPYATCAFAPLSQEELGDSIYLHGANRSDSYFVKLSLSLSSNTYDRLYIDPYALADNLLPSKALICPVFLSKTST